LLWRLHVLRLLLGQGWHSIRHHHVAKLLLNLIYQLLLWMLTRLLLLLVKRLRQLLLRLRLNHGTQVEHGASSLVLQLLMPDKSWRWLEIMD